MRQNRDRDEQGNEKGERRVLPENSFFAGANSEKQLLEG